MNTLQTILDWSEVWALLIPLFAWIIIKHPQPGMKPVIVYLLIALVLNVFGDFIAEFKKFIPTLPRSNNPIYNIHSLVRFGCFSWFFIQMGATYYQRVQSAILVLYITLIAFNFIFIENFFNPAHLSGNLLTIESFLLLASCMVFYLALLKNDTSLPSKQKSFWVTTGLSIFFVINFFVFLFYVPLINENRQLTNWMWNFHNIAYITLCIFITKAFYVPAGD